MTALAAIYACRRAAGLDDDIARDVYERITGKRSLKAMSRAEQNAVAEEFRDIARRTRNAPHRRKLEGKYAKKLQALWIAAWNLGVVRERDDAALLSFVRRQTGIDHTRFLTHADDAAKAIEALKKWLAREGGVDWRGREWRKKPGAAIAEAQWGLLVARGQQPPFDFFSWCVNHHLGRPQHTPLEDVTPGQWQALMNELGRLVREARR